MKLEKPPQEKHLVLYTHVRIIDKYKSKWAENNVTKCKEKNILKQEIQHSADFQNILW